MIIPDARRIYSTLHNKIKKLWGFDPMKPQSNNLNTLTGFICGIIQSKQVKLDDVVADIPSVGKEESKIMPLRRWLKKETVNVELFYLPLIESLRYCLSHQTLVLAIDGSTVARGCTLWLSVSSTRAEHCL